MSWTDTFNNLWSEFKYFYRSIFTTGHKLFAFGVEIRTSNRTYQIQYLKELKGYLLPVCFATAKIFFAVFKFQHFTVPSPEQLRRNFELGWIDRQCIHPRYNMWISCTKLISPSCADSIAWSNWRSLTLQILIFLLAQQVAANLPSGENLAQQTSSIPMLAIKLVFKLLLWASSCNTKSFLSGIDQIAMDRSDEHEIIWFLSETSRQYILSYFYYYFLTA